MILVKYYNRNAERFEGLGSFYVQKNGKVADLIPRLLKRKGLPHDMPVQLFEEIKPMMIEEMNIDKTFIASEIQDGDIICFQEKLVAKPVSPATGDVKLDARGYYDFLMNRLIVQFKPRAPESHGLALKEIELGIHKLAKYDTVASLVGRQIGVDPMKLRFIHVNTQSGHIQYIGRTQHPTLSEMFPPMYSISLSGVSVLYYEIADISMMEFETKRLLRIGFLGKHVREESSHELLVGKTCSVHDVLLELVTRLNLPKEHAEKLRMYEAVNSRLEHIYNPGECISNIPDTSALYVEVCRSDALFAF